MCDNGNRPLSARGWCAKCEAEFVTVMETINCSNNSVCMSPITCKMLQRCVQLRAALTLVNGKGL